MEREERTDGFTALEDRFADYEVYDQNYERIGSVDDLFVDENDQPEYIGVKMGFLGTRTTLIPMDMVRVNDERQLVQVAADKDKVKDGPTFDDGRSPPRLRARFTPTMAFSARPPPPGSPQPTGHTTRKEPPRLRSLELRSTPQNAPTCLKRTR
jgi:hypothetical protein